MAGLIFAEMRPENAGLPQRSDPFRGYFFHSDKIYFFNDLFVSYILCRAKRDACRDEVGTTFGFEIAIFTMNARVAQRII